MQPYLAAAQQHCFAWYFCHGGYRVQSELLTGTCRRASLKAARSVPQDADRSPRAPDLMSTGGEAPSAAPRPTPYPRATAMPRQAAEGSSVAEPVGLGRVATCLQVASWLAWISGMRSGVDMQVPGPAAAVSRAAAGRSLLGSGRPATAPLLSARDVSCATHRGKPGRGYTLGMGNGWKSYCSMQLALAARYLAPRHLLPRRQGTQLAPPTVSPCSSIPRSHPVAQPVLLQPPSHRRRAQTSQPAGPPAPPRRFRSSWATD